ncbi:hypothetical protein BaRGS_00019075 [Batillaria attramentaria]|uniref:Uncharacterized protein n=1 Tax=Batillaria attramentaria TaxID=370345 RepID=A0ABD0KRB7_9CAEN
MAVPWNFTLNVNLLEGAGLHLDLLQEVMSHPTLEDERAMKQALFRYENYWMPLAAKHPSETLAAPLDVEWMWHCHMLSPLHYQHDCNQVAGRIISHKLYSTMQRRKQQHKARALWQVEYPQEPFNLELEPGLYFSDDDVPSRLSCDVIASAHAQRVFYYQVSLPHYRDTEFLKASEVRYKKFLFLQQHNPETLLVPCHDMDLMWHTHLLHPLAYKIDMETILCRTLSHGVVLDDPNSCPEVTEAFGETRNLWRKTFETNFEVCGGIHRGLPTAGRLHCMTPQQNFMASTKTAMFTIEKVDVQGLPRMKGKLVFKVYTGLDGKIAKCAATLKGAPPWQGKALPSTELATQCVNYLKLRAIDQTGVLKCLGTREVVGERDIDLRPTLDSLTHETSIEHSVSLSKVHGAIPAQVTTHFCWPQRGPVHLYLRVGIFTPHPIPADSPETLWGPVPLPGPPSRLEHVTCHVASHSLVNHSESVVMTCRMLHCPDLLQSAVHVLYQDKMTAVAHLVGLDQLPLPTQVCDPRKVPYLNPRTGERAVLIKNHSGDWAVVVGRWVSVKKGGSRLGSRRGRDGLAGQLMIRVRELDDFGWREQQLTYADQQWTFSLHDLVADLKNGTLRIDNPDCQDIAEKVALTFSVALLHVLCMPRPAGWKRNHPLRRSISRRGTRSSKWIPSDEMPFVIAAGVLQDTPNNTFIRKAGGQILVSGVELVGAPSVDVQSCRPEDGLGGMWAHVAGGVTDLLAPPDVEAERDSNISLQVNGNTLTVEGAWRHESFDSSDLALGPRKTSESSRSDDVTSQGRKTKLDKSDSGESAKGKKKKNRLKEKKKLTKASSDGAVEKGKKKKVSPKRSDVAAIEIRTEEYLSNDEGIVTVEWSKQTEKSPNNLVPNDKHGQEKSQTTDTSKEEKTTTDDPDTVGTTTDQRMKDFRDSGLSADTTLCGGSNSAGVSGECKTRRDSEQSGASGEGRTHADAGDNEVPAEKRTKNQNGVSAVERAHPDCSQHSGVSTEKKTFKDVAKETGTSDRAERKNTGDVGDTETLVVKSPSRDNAGDTTVAHDTENTQVECPNTCGTTKDKANDNSTQESGVSLSTQKSTSGELAKTEELSRKKSAEERRSDDTSPNEKTADRREKTEHSTLGVVRSQENKGRDFEVGSLETGHVNDASQRGTSSSGADTDLDCEQLHTGGTGQTKDGTASGRQREEVPHLSAHPSGSAHNGDGCVS